MESVVADFGKIVEDLVEGRGAYRFGGPWKASKAMAAILPILRVEGSSSPRGYVTWVEAGATAHASVVASDTGGIGRPHVKSAGQDFSD
jgi:hypothetical protein